MNDTPRSAATKTSVQPAEGFSKEERAAIKERAAELRAEARLSKASDRKAVDASAVLAAIAEMSESDRALAERLHAVITQAAPGLDPKLWYGMPAYASDGKIVCFFQAAEKFKTRYATLGFNDVAHLDEGTMWPTAFALTQLAAADEARIVALIKRAAG